MPALPARVRERLVAGIKRYQPVFAAAKARDVNESDTVTIIKDVLADVFGFDKYTEITSEYLIRGTFVDLATRLEGKLVNMIEVKAIGLELKEAYIKQAVDYASNEGVDWVVLTNGAVWQVYKVHFVKPIERELVTTIDFLALNPKKEADLEALFLLTREGYAKRSLEEYHSQRQALSRYFVGAMLLSEPLLEVLRRELRRVTPDVRIELDELEAVLVNEVLKREVVEGEKAEEAQKKAAKAAGKALRKVERKPRAEAKLEPAGVSVTAAGESIEVTHP